MNRRSSIVIISLFGLSLLLIAFLIREMLVYDLQAKQRFYARFKKTGLIDEEVALNQIRTPGTYVILAIGQSNAASTSNVTYTPRNNVFNYYRGSLYVAKEPLAGSGGDGGSVWPILADRLIDSGICKNVVIVPAAIGSTSAEDWASGFANVKLMEIMDELNKQNIKLTHILWHQGESDTGADKEVYKSNLSKLLRSIRLKGQEAPFYCSIATYNAYINNSLNGVDTNLQSAQREFIAENQGVLEGPNTDHLIYAIDRHDGQHFSGIGNQKYAGDWLRAIRAGRE